MPSRHDLGVPHDTRFSRRTLLRLLGIGAGGALAVSCSKGERDADVPGDGPSDTERDPSGQQEPIEPSGDGPTPGADYASSGFEPAAGDTDAQIQCEPTTSDVLGPYHEPGAPSRAQIAAADEPGERLRVTGAVYGPDCRTPVAGVMLDVWQADVDGNYHAASETGYRLRGKVMTDAEGRYELDTIMPGRYALADGPRPAHIHFQVVEANHATLTTQLYFEGDPFLAPNDACGSGCNSDELGRIVAVEGSAPLRATFDIVLAAV